MENTKNNTQEENVKVDVDNGFACDINTGTCSTSPNATEEVEASVAQIKSGKLIYVGDPICSSCFAFASEIKALKKEFEGKLDFQIVLGGLRPYGRESITTMRDYLLPHFENLARMTGLPIQSGILGDSSFILDTEPPSRAIRIARELAPELELEFYEQVQRAFYLDNSDTNFVEAYLGFVEDFGIDKEVFKSKFESTEMKNLVKADFELARSLGVNAFPTLLLESERQISIVSRGYAKSTALIPVIKSRLKTETSKA